MYVSLISDALDLWRGDLDDEALLDYVRVCRARVPTRDVGVGTLSESALVAEISYDRALVCLAAHCGIAVAPTNFIHPRTERERLEYELELRGFDLEIQMDALAAPLKVPSPDS